MYIKTHLKPREGTERGDQRIHDHLHTHSTYIQVSTVCIECR